MIRSSLTQSAFTALCLSFSLASTASAQSSFVGVWKNVNKKTRGVTKLVITKHSIRAFGKCHPKDCDWGSRKLYLLGTSVNSKSLPYGLAIWNQKFAVRYMTLKRSRQYLVAEVYTVFLDKSRRSNYKSVYVFRRSLRVLPVDPRKKIRKIRIRN